MEWNQITLYILKISQHLTKIQYIIKKMQKDLLIYLDYQ